MALNDYDKQVLLDASEDFEFPAVVVFRSSGLSSWEPEWVSNAEVLAEYIGSEQCPEWKEVGAFGIGKNTDCELMGDREFFEGLLVPEFRSQAGELAELANYEGLEHFAVDAFMESMGYEWTHKGWLPEDHDGYEDE